MTHGDGSKVPPSTPRKITGEYGSLDLFDTYSASEYADARALHWWLMVPGEGRQRGVLVLPHRRPPFGNAILTEIAMETRDLGALMGVVSEESIPGLEDRTAAVSTAVDQF